MTINHYPSLAFVKKQLLHWAASFPYCLFLDNCESDIDEYGEYELLIGIGREGCAILDIEAAQKHAGKWIMGGIPYELSDVKARQYTAAEEMKAAPISFPHLAFFEAEIVIYILKGEKEVRMENKSDIPFSIENIFNKNNNSNLLNNEGINFKSNFTKKEYLESIQSIIENIKDGDFYEINLTQCFETKAKLIEPHQIFLDLTKISPSPFAAFFRFETKYVICASPERFLQLSDNQLLTQPMKGTAARGKTKEEDEALKKQLQESEKEQAENVMIVDLSRNDLQRCCDTSSVKVPQLFYIQSFPQVHQMVSSIVGRKREELDVWDVIDRTFPPGSMTGAPKVAVMQAISQYEKQQRGMYSGSLGYIRPDGDFDFNVVIRSLIYDAQSGQLSYQVGGAITYDSDPESEYQETLLKAEAIRLLFA